jgi:2-haloacid dehalogenase
VYEHAAGRLDRSVGDCRLVSSNAWDVAGAGAAGMRTAWVNRRNDPPEELGADPDVELASLAELPDTVV